MSRHYLNEALDLYCNIPHYLGNSFSVWLNAGVLRSWYAYQNLINVEGSTVSSFIVSPAFGKRYVSFDVSCGSADSMKYWSRDRPVYGYFDYGLLLCGLWHTSPNDHHNMRSERRTWRSFSEKRKRFCGPFFATCTSRQFFFIIVAHRHLRPMTSANFNLSIAAIFATYFMFRILAYRQSGSVSNVSYCTSPYSISRQLVGTALGTFCAERNESQLRSWWCTV